MRAQLAQAALAGFHDTIWLLVGVSLLGCLTALLLRGGSGGSSRQDSLAASNM